MSDKKTVNEVLLKLEKEDPKGAAEKVRSQHLRDLDAPRRDACEDLTHEVMTAFGIDQEKDAHLLARILRLENPGKL